MGTEAARLPRSLWVVAGLGGLGLAVYGLRNVLAPIFFAFLIAYLLDPLVDRFEARGVPRSAGIVAVLVVALGGITLFALLLLPSVVREVLTFGEELPERLRRFQASIAPWLRGYGVELPHDLGELRSMVEGALGGGGGEGAAASGKTLASGAASVLAAVGRFVWGGTSTLLGFLTSLLVVPVLAFYLLHDFDRLTAGIEELIPHRYRPFVVDVAREVDQVLGQFIRGQLSVMLILAVLYSVAYSIAGIRLAVPIGIVAGLLSFIPYVGGASALLLALAMCALGFEGWWQVGAVVLGYGIIQALEGTVITPRIVGEKVGLPAVWVLIALMVGGELFGFTGVLLAVPMAAVAKIFVMRGVAYYRKSRIFLEGGPELDGPLAGLLVEEGLPDDAPLAREKAAARGEEPAPDEPEPGHAAGGPADSGEEE